MCYDSSYRNLQKVDVILQYGFHKIWKKNHRTCTIKLQYIYIKVKNGFGNVATCKYMGVYHKCRFEIGMVYQKRDSCFSSRIHIQLPVLSLHVINMKVSDVFF